MVGLSLWDSPGAVPKSDGFGGPPVWKPDSRMSTRFRLDRVEEGNDENGTYFHPFHRYGLIDHARLKTERGEPAGPAMGPVSSGAARAASTIALRARSGTAGRPDLVVSWVYAHAGREQIGPDRSRAW